jgi:acyl-CoA thioesterase I
VSVRGVTALAIALALTVGCANRGETARRLPADRDARVVYVALGDSTVAGVGASAPDRTYVARIHARLRSVYPQASVVNLGVSGATSADVLREQLSRAIELRPGLVTLSVGPNDITAFVGVDAFADNVRAIFRRLTGETPAVVIANLLPDMAVTPRFRRRPEREAVARRVIEFNEALRREAGPYGVELVDLHAPSRAEVPQRPELIAADGYHPSDEGYARWAELLWHGIEPRTPTP